MSSDPHRAVTMRDVARLAGVHVTTVSLALRNSPQLPPHTRERIQSLARKLGYRTNPLVVAFVQQRRMTHRARFQGTLAFITSSTPEIRAIRSNTHVIELFKTAAAHAAVLGFKLEHFETLDYGTSPVRLEKALHARNIRGLVFAPTEQPGGEIVDLNWDHFAAVTISTSIQRPALDRATHDHFGGARLAVKTALDRGYRKPGYVSLASTDHRTQGRWRGGFLAGTQGAGRLRAAPVLVAPDEALPAAFLDWFRSRRPDVIIANNLALQLCLPGLAALGVSLPRDAGLIDLNINDPGSPHSGILAGLPIISRTAVEHVVSRLYRNALGLSDPPNISLSPPVWHEGLPTLPPRVVPAWKKPGRA